MPMQTNLWETGAQGSYGDASSSHNRSLSIHRWANYVTAYVNDLDRFCGLLGRVLKPGGAAVVVVGNSIVQGHEIKVEERLSEIAEVRGLTALGVNRLRDRVGSSIVNSGARQRRREGQVI